MYISLSYFVPLLTALLHLIYLLFLLFCPRFIPHLFVNVFFLLILGSIKEHTALFAAIIFMTTYSINYWVLNQGFTSWGTCLLPLCLIPLVDLKNHHFPVVKIAVSMAVMTQIHMLTAVMLGLIYFPFFISYAKNRWGTACVELIKAIGIYGCLSIDL